MKLTTAGHIRRTRGRVIRALLAFVAAVSLIGAPASAAPAAAGAGGWYDGLIQYSTITNCISMIQGTPYLESGAGVYVGYYANPDSALPAVNQVYYLHAVMYGLGNACAGQYGVPYLVLPANTHLAIDGTNKVFCFAGGLPETNSCPQSLPLNPSLGYLIKPTTQTMWPLPQGGSWEFQVPVISTTALTSSQFGAYFVMADGNANPTLVATQNAFVFTPGVAAVSYPSPNTINITRTGATSYVNLVTGASGGEAFFDLGTTTSYGYSEGTGPLAGNSSFQSWDTWNPGLLQPDTLYHYRVRWVPTTGSPVIGTDQTFRTLGAATSLSVSGLISGQNGGAPQTVTVTAKDASAPAQTSGTYRGTVQFSSDDASALLPADYTFTAGDNGSHTFSVRFNAAGTHILTVRDKANATITGSQGGISVTTTLAAPTATITSLAAWKTSTAIGVAWNGASGASNYDVRYRKAAYNGGFGAPILWKSATTAKSGSFTGAAGTTYCWSTRSRNGSTGVVSAWTAETCTTIPLDERSMTKAGTWTAGTGSAYYKGTYLKATAAGAKLTRTGVQFNRLAIVATTCPTCGKVGVYLNGALLKTVSLVSSATVNKKVITVYTTAFVPSGTALKAGTLVLKVATSGKKVLIDGIVVSRYAN